jgi:phosphotriesterase-related protein
VEVQTVTGPVDSGTLGFTLMHEHVITTDPEITSNYPGWWDEAAEVAAARAELTRLKGLGVDTLVDLTVVGLGRDVSRVREIAAPTGLNIIAATGIYVMGELPRFFTRRGPGTPNGGPDPLEKLFIQDITEGIAGAGIRAGIIKCVTDDQGLTPDVEHALRASAAAHRATGVPISTHTSAGSRRGLDQQRVFAAQGVDLSRVIIGHSGDSTDLDYLMRLMDAGSYIGMDRFGMSNILPTQQRCETVAALAARGYAGQMVLSHDAHCYSLNWDPGVRAAVLPDWHLGFISSGVLPMLAELGVSPTQIDQMMTVNPREIFSRGDAY